MSKNTPYEQVDMFQTSLIQKTSTENKTPAKQKPPFIPVQTMALDEHDIKNNFMYMIRILLNNSQKAISTPKGQEDYLETLIHEMKIKKGLIAPAIAVRNGALKSNKRN